jgi:hypothetical protein
VRSTAAPYTESRLTRSVANERVGFPVVEQVLYFYEVLSHEKSVNRRRGEHLRERAHRGEICVLHCAPEKRLSRAPTALPILLSP